MRTRTALTTEKWTSPRSPVVLELERETEELWDVVLLAE